MLHLVLDSKETQGKILGWAHDIMAANGEKSLFWDSLIGNIQYNQAYSEIPEHVVVKATGGEGDRLRRRCLDVVV